MDYLCVGINHKKTPIRMRERLVFSYQELDQTLKSLREFVPVEEGVIVSTCNRMEVYTATGDQAGTSRGIKVFLSQYRDVALKDLEPFFYEHHSLQAIKHLFRVAASLDAMVIGETQITQQIKQAFDSAMAARHSGSYLNPCLNRALHVAKRVREETDISSGTVSIGSMAVKLAERIFGDLEAKQVCVIGAGTHAKLVMTHLQQARVTDIVCLNRTEQRARALAEGHGVTVGGLDQLEEKVNSADIVISSIDVSKPLLTYELIREARARRRSRPLLLIDLGVPRNIAPSAGTLASIFLYNIDDLSEVIQENLNWRSVGAGRAESLIDREALEFHQHMMRHHPTLASLNKKADQIRRHELERTLAQLKHLSANDKQIIDKLSSVIVRKVLHDPIQVLKNNEGTEEDWGAKDLLRRLFRLDDLDH